MLSINQQMRWRENLNAMQRKIFWSIAAFYTVEQTNFVLSDAELLIQVRSLISLFRSTKQTQFIPAKTKLLQHLTSSSSALNAKKWNLFRSTAGLVYKQNHELGLQDHL